jgi:hypothetical protein
MPPLTNAMTTAVPLREVGMSSGLLNLVRNVGGAFGIAIFGTLLVNATDANVAQVARYTEVHSASPQTLALVQALVVVKAEVLAYGTVFLWAAFGMAMGGVATILYLRVHRNEEGPSPEVRAEAAAG